MKIARDVHMSNFPMWAGYKTNSPFKAVAPICQLKKQLEDDILNKYIYAYLFDLLMNQKGLISWFQTYICYEMIGTAAQK